MSPRRPSRSSRASRNTSLSSTSATRTGGGIAQLYPGLLGRQKQRIVGLAAGMDLELEVRVALRHAGEQAAQLRFLLAGDESENVARLAQQPVDDRGSH